MDTTPHPVSRFIGIIRRHMDKVLIAASGITILIGGYFTYDYRTYTDCQVQLADASQVTTTTFAESLRILLAQPPRPAEERRQAFEKLQQALQQQLDLQAELGNCK